MISDVAVPAQTWGLSVNNVSSSFQRRMLEADAGKSLGNVLWSEELDALLVELVDERSDMMAGRDERITDSLALLESVTRWKSAYPEANSHWKR